MNCQPFQIAAPEPWPDQLDLSPLLRDLREEIITHVVVPQKSADALALWGLHTYLYAERETAVYVAIESLHVFQQYAYQRTHSGQRAQVLWH